MSSSIAIFYGSSTGNTEMAAEKIKEELGDFVQHMADVSKCEPAELGEYDILLLGVSTWNIGEMQDDWDAFIPRMEGLDLSGKKVGFFAMGDAGGYPYNFLDAMGQLWDVVKGLGSPELVGVWPTEGYVSIIKRHTRSGNQIPDQLEKYTMRTTHETALPTTSGQSWKCCLNP